MAWGLSNIQNNQIKGYVLIYTVQWQLILLIDPLSTSWLVLDPHPDWYLVNIQTTVNQHLNWDLINNHTHTRIHWLKIIWLSNNCWPRCWWNINWVSTKLLMECQSIEARSTVSRWWAECQPTHMHQLKISWLLTNCPPRCWWNNDGVSTKLSIVLTDY